MAAKKYACIFLVIVYGCTIAVIINNYKYTAIALASLAFAGSLFTFISPGTNKKEVDNYFYEDILEQSGISTVITDKNGVIKFISKNIDRLYGYTKETMVGRHITECVITAYRQQVNDIIESIKNDGVYEDTIQMQVFTKKHIKRWVAFRIHKIEQNNGVYNLQIMLWDIEKEKALQLEVEAAALRNKKQQMLLQTIIDHSPAIIYLKDLEGNYVLSNVKTKQLAGVNNNDDINNVELHPEPEKRAFYREQDMRVVREKRMVTFQTEYTYRNGNTVTLWIMKFPIFNEKSEVEYVAGISTDITSLKQSAQIVTDAREELGQAKQAYYDLLADINKDVSIPVNDLPGLLKQIPDINLAKEQEEKIEMAIRSAQNTADALNNIVSQRLKKPNIM